MEKSSIMLYQLHRVWLSRGPSLPHRLCKGTVLEKRSAGMASPFFPLQPWKSALQPCPGSLHPSLGPQPLQITMFSPYLLRIYQKDIVDINIQQVMASSELKRLGLFKGKLEGGPSKDCTIQFIQTLYKRYKICYSSFSIPFYLPEEVFIDIL